MRGHQPFTNTSVRCFGCPFKIGLTATNSIHNLQANQLNEANTRLNDGKILNIDLFKWFPFHCYRNRERLRCNGILIISKA